MKFTIWRNKEEKYKFLCLLFLIIAIIFTFIFFNRNTYKADVDGDGIKETIQLIEYQEGGALETIYDDNGIIYRTLYNSNGGIVIKWKIIPSENKEDPPTILVWDEKSKQWLPDQNKDGVPDYKEN